MEEDDDRAVPQPTATRSELAMSSDRATALFRPRRSSSLRPSASPRGLFTDVHADIASPRVRISNDPRGAPSGIAVTVDLGVCKVCEEAAPR